jgi:hypothetical protein
MCNMEMLLLPLIVAARRYSEDGAEWVQLLVFIIVGVFVLLRNVMRARSAKKGDAESRCIGSGKAVGRPTDRLKKYIEQARQAEQATVTPGPAAGVPKVQQKKPVELPIVGPAGPRQMTSRLQEASTVKTVDRYIGKTDAETAPVSPDVSGSELLDEYGDTDKLRRAILHYEILGRPLALRMPGEKNVPQ